MTEKSICKRLIFPSKAQRLFIEQALAIVTTAELARLCECSERSIRDWKREKFSLPQSAADAISLQLDIPIPQGAQPVDAYAHTSRAGKKGGAATIKKYGKVPVRAEYRAERWQQWWDTKGKAQSNFPWKARAIPSPKPSIKLAELVGILMGDGGISTYQITISLNKETDAEYIDFVCSLFEELFELSPSIYFPPTSKVATVVVSRRKLVEYFHKLGLPIGHKNRQGLDVPDWIKKNRKYRIACVRGLVDTDGSVIKHRYSVAGKEYVYKKLDYTSRSVSLLHSVANILSELGLRIGSTHASSIRLESKADMERYFKIVGSHNPKHLKRYYD